MSEETPDEEHKLTEKEKKKLRKKKSKDAKKALKEATKQAHEGLHDAQEAEQDKQRNRKEKRAAPVQEPVLDLGNAQVVVEYVAEPLEALEGIKAAVDEAAVAGNPYEGLEGLDVTTNEPSSVVTELERVAKHFVPQLESEKENVALAGDAVPDDVVIKEAVEEEESEDESEDGGLKSNKERKREKNDLTSQMIAHLKQECPRPEVVEVWDIRAKDPKLLVFLKAYRNTVPVPRHWSQKRKYLQGKRGIEKPPFALPSFIQTTGISDMRSALEEKVQMKLKSKGRQRMRPKMGKMEINYNVLHDAFFKFQTKPNMSGLGNLYYEGKEFENRPNRTFPGVLSEELRVALGMTDTSPPPWLINMQRYGPPPSYPSLKIPGLNAPIPPGAEFGYHPGGWGKPPVDHDGQPLYGDVFGVGVEPEEELAGAEKARRWGELEEIESSDEEEEEEEEEEPQITQEQLEQGIASGMVTGLASTLDPGIETNTTLELRKQGGTTTTGGTPLYQVLEQKPAGPTAGLVAAGHVYEMPGGGQSRATAAATAAKSKRLEGLQGSQAGTVEVAVDPEDLERTGLEQLYQQAAGGGGPKEDYSDLMAARKRKQDASMAAKAGKKQKDSFKF